MVSNLHKSIPSQIIDVIKTIHAPIKEVEDRLTWKFTGHGEYTVKTVTWTNNDFIHPHRKAKFIKCLKVKLTVKLKIFAWKLIRNILLIKK